MRIAIFGDIHGNIDALKATYNTAQTIGIDKLYHTGDLGGYAPFVNEVVEFLVEHDIEGVQGNYDEAVAHDNEHCGCKYEDQTQADMTQLSFEWTKQHASDDTKRYLGLLPEEIAFTESGKTCKLFHATPSKNNLYWYEKRPERFFHEMASRANADVMIYAHTHIPYRKNIDGKVFINAGSVGKPKDGDTRACLTLVGFSSDEVQSEFVRVAYDIDKVADAIIKSGMPTYWAERLLQGK